MTSLSFATHLSRFDDNIALMDDDNSVSYNQLEIRVADFAKQVKLLSEDRVIVLLKMRNSIQSVVHYLGALRANSVVILVNEKMAEATFSRLVETLSPQYLLDDEGLVPTNKPIVPISSKLQLVLPTSGSTGAGKCVALSDDNLQANCQSILNYLPIEAADNCLASMPFSYSYGLSLLHTHLAVGATVVMTNATAMDKSWWERLKTLPIHSLAGVPHWYEMLIRLGLTKQALPELKYMTQAGGKLDQRWVTALSDYALKTSKQFFVMYGQTEATARIGYLAPSLLNVKPNSIGKAIPDGFLSLKDEKGQRIDKPNIEGELVYEGPNIMLGYVESSKDMQAFNPTACLNTGDIGYFDEDGDFFITGRKKRVLKIFGERLNLDQLEVALAQNNIDAKCCGMDNRVFIAVDSALSPASTNVIRQLLPFPPKAVHLVKVDAFPLLTNGKTDYPSLLHLCKHNETLVRES